MKSLKQIADELGLPKQRVYRVALRLGVEPANVAESRHVYIYDADAEARIKAALSNVEANVEVHQSTSEAHHSESVDAVKVIEILRVELAEKNKQIDALHAQVAQLTETVAATAAALQSAQALHAIQQQLDRHQQEQEIEDVVLVEDDGPKRRKSWWEFWRR